MKRDGDAEARGDRLQPESIEGADRGKEEDRFQRQSQDASNRYRRGARSRRISRTAKIPPDRGGRERQSKPDRHPQSIVAPLQPQRPSAKRADSSSRNLRVRFAGCVPRCRNDGRRPSWRTASIVVPVPVSDKGRPLPQQLVFELMYPSRWQASNRACRSGGLNGYFRGTAWSRRFCRAHVRVCWRRQRSRQSRLMRRSG